MQKKERRKGDIKVKTGNKRKKDQNRKLVVVHVDTQSDNE